MTCQLPLRFSHVSVHVRQRGSGLPTLLLRVAVSLPYTIARLLPKKRTLASNSRQSSQ